jgi:hypothetical protein
MSSKAMSVVQVVIVLSFVARTLIWQVFTIATREARI